MKKVLFATTALIATASMAAAEVRISGYGRFGYDYNEANTAPTSSSNITSRLRIQFDMSTETDSGVGLGARLRFQTESRDGVVNGNGTAGTTTGNAARFYASYEGITVFVGNIIGALDNLPNIYLPTTSVALGIDGMGFDHLIWTDAYTVGTSTGRGPNGVEVLYSNGGFTGHISYSDHAVANGGDGNARTGIMLAYTFGDWTIGGAYQASDAVNNDIFAITVGGNLGNFGVQAGYADNDGSEKWMLAGNVDVGAAGNIVAYVADDSAATDTAFGLEYNYDLGGGATFVVAAQQGTNGMTEAQAGVHFKF